MTVRRPLLIAVVLALLAGGAFVFLEVRAAAERAAAVDQLLADVDRALEVADADAVRDELSRLYARLSELGPADPRVAIAMARIDVRRGRHHLAMQHLEPLMIGNPPLPALRAATRAWLDLPLHGGRDRVERRGYWRQALSFAERAHERSGEPADLFGAWQAAVRLGEKDEIARLVEALVERHQRSLEARTAKALYDLEDFSADPGPLEAIAAEWYDPPIELELARAILRLGREEVHDAVRRLDELLAAAPNLVEVRASAAAAHHEAAEGLPAGPQRTRHTAMRDEQLAWLADNAAPDDRRRDLWARMRGRP